MPAGPPYDSRVVANAFLELGADSLVPITPMKLQKLVYFADGWNRVLNGRPLVADPVEAWQFGPVFPTLYHEFRVFGGQPIDRFYRRQDRRAGRFAIPEVESAPERDVIEQVWHDYGRRSGTDLSAMTHQPGTPWDRTVATRGHGVEIDPALVEQAFEALRAGRTADA